MDLNYLYHRYGVSLQMSANAACVPSRMAHRQMADAYRAQIAHARIHGSTAVAA